MPLLGKDFECVQLQRIFASLTGAAGRREEREEEAFTFSHASRGGGGVAVTCDGGDSNGRVAWPFSEVGELDLFAKFMHNCCP